MTSKSCGLLLLLFLLTCSGCGNSAAQVQDGMTKLSQSLEQFGGAIDPVGVKMIFAAYREELARSQNLEKALAAATQQLNDEINDDKRPVFRVEFTGQNNATIKANIKGVEKSFAEYEGSNGHELNPCEVWLTARDLVPLVNKKKDLELVFQYCHRGGPGSRITITIKNSKGQTIRHKEEYDTQNPQVRTWEPDPIPLLW